MGGLDVFHQAPAARPRCSRGQAPRGEARAAPGQPGVGMIFLIMTAHRGSSMVPVMVSAQTKRSAPSSARSSSSTGLRRSAGSQDAARDCRSAADTAELHDDLTRGVDCMFILAVSTHRRVRVRQAPITGQQATAGSMAVVARLMVPLQGRSYPGVREPREEASPG